MPKTLVCGIDAGKGGVGVAREAGRLARDLEARLVLVHVYHEDLLLPDSSEATRNRARRAGQERGEDLLRRIGPEFPPGIEADYRVVVGPVAKTLATVAEQEGAALIIIGRGRAGVIDWLRPSRVSKKVFRRASCPVVLIPQTGTGGDGSSKSGDTPGTQLDGGGDETLVVVLERRLRALSVRSGCAGPMSPSGMGSGHGALSTVPRITGLSTASDR